MAPVFETGLYEGADTSPAGPCPKACPPTVLSNGLNPNSSVGIPNCVNLASYVLSKSLCAWKRRKTHQNMYLYKE